MVGLVSGYFGGWVDCRADAARRRRARHPVPALRHRAGRPSSGRAPATSCSASRCCSGRTPRASSARRCSPCASAPSSRRRASPAPSTWRILFVHVAPNILPLSFLYGSIAIGWAILTEASISFLGFGPSDTVSWGYMLQDAYASQALSRGGYNWFVPPGHVHRAGRGRRASSSAAATRKSCSPSSRIDPCRSSRSRISRSNTRAGGGIVHGGRSRHASTCSQGPGRRAGRRVRLRQDHARARDHRRDAAQRAHRRRARSSSRAAISPRLSDAQKRDVLWREIAFIPQSAMNALDPVYRVGSQIREVLVERGGYKRPRRRRASTSCFASSGSIPAASTTIRTSSPAACASASASRSRSRSIPSS